MQVNTSSSFQVSLFLLKLTDSAIEIATAVLQQPRNDTKTHNLSLREVLIHRDDEAISVFQRSLYQFGRSKFEMDIYTVRNHNRHHNRGKD